MLVKAGGLRGRETKKKQPDSKQRETQYDSVGIDQHDAHATHTSSSPFSAASWSGVPPQLSVTISPPCSSSQLSTLAWPRLAAKCMAEAPSPSLSARLMSVKLTWRRKGHDNQVTVVSCHAMKWWRVLLGQVWEKSFNIMNHWVFATRDFINTSILFYKCSYMVNFLEMLWQWNRICSSQHCQKKKKISIIYCFFIIKCVEQKS